MKTFDRKSYDLAEHFLQDAQLDPSKRTLLTTRLAAHIQEAVEEWLGENVETVVERFPSGAWLG